MQNRYFHQFCTLFFEDMIKHIKVNDRLEMKKSHPCGGNIFKVLYVGTDLKILCETCGRQMVLNRIKLEKGVKRIISENSNDK